MFTSALDYELPARLIATHPVEPRDSCRLMVVSRSDPRRIEHRVFRDLADYLRPGDLMVFNTTRVLPAKIQGSRADTGAAVEGLFVRASSPGRWHVMLKTGTNLKPGHLVALKDNHGRATPISLRIEGRDQDQWVVTVVNAESGETVTEPESAVLDRVGATPLPPYIRKARTDASDATDDDLDREWYQCVYAEAGAGAAGSVAAPTAGLHFTPELLEKIAARGVRRADVRLDVGLGTFKPIQTDTLAEHPIHSETIDIPGPTVRALEQTHSAAGRVIAIGTTSVRAIESLPDHADSRHLDGGLRTSTSLFITPGFQFRHTDALVTNFHLPRSTLLAMVGALFEGGVPRLLTIYREAVKMGYRFYSYGDAMVVMP